MFLPVVIAVLFLNTLPNITYPPLASFISLYDNFGPYRELNIKDIFIGAFLIDYLVTVIIGIVNKKPQFFFYGLFFFFMHIVVSAVLISAIIPGFFGKSEGRWVSPKRQKS